MPQNHTGTDFPSMPGVCPAARKLLLTHFHSSPPLKGNIVPKGSSSVQLNVVQSFRTVLLGNPPSLFAGEGRLFIPSPVFNSSQAQVHYSWFCHLSRLIYTAEAGKCIFFFSCAWLPSSLASSAAPATVAWKLKAKVLY